MRYKQTVLEIATYYDQPMYMPDSKELHPKIAVLKKWMIDNIKEKDLDAFRDKVLYKFKFFPKIAELMEVINEKKLLSYEIQAENNWQLLLKKSSSDDALIVDEASAYVVSGYGSWHYFCIERDDNREWTHKNFIQRYVAFRESGEKFKPVVLLGSYKCLYGSNFHGVRTIIIGDETEGQKLLENSSNQDKISDLISTSFKRLSE